jgi:hypothetical protein
MDDAKALGNDSAQRQAERANNLLSNYDPQGFRSSDMVPPLDPPAKAE